MVRAQRPAACLALIATGLLAATFGGAVLAQEVRQYGTTDAVDPTEVARILGPAPAKTPKMRSLRILDPSAAPMEPGLQPTATAGDAAAQVSGSDARALSLLV